MKVKVRYSLNVSEVYEVDLVLEATTRGEWVIGRAPDSDVVLDSLEVSRLHAKFLVKDGSYYFCDLGSTNGSIVNGQQAEKDRPYILKDGDIIEIADCVLIVEAVEHLSEQLPETVFRTMDTSLFSGVRSTENVNSYNVANPAAEGVNHDSTEEFSQTIGKVKTPEIVNAASPEISESSKVAFTQPDEIIPVFEAFIARNDIIQAQPEVVEVFSNEYIDFSTTRPEEVSIDVSDIAVTSFPTNVGKVSESTNTLQSIETIEESLHHKVAEEANINVSPQIITQRNIVLIAHESKKLELAEFVAQYQEFFLQSFTITWPSVSEVLHHQTGITISQQISAATSGGYLTIASLVSSGDVLAVIFLRDFLQPQPEQANEEALLRLCNINQVLLATNVATAEAIVHYIKHIAE